jgi:hypothetical protein
MDYSVDFLEKTGANINFDIGQLSFGGMNKQPYGWDNVANKPAVLTVFPRDTPESEKPLQSLKEEPKRKRPGQDSQALAKTTRYSKSRLVKTALDATIAPRCRHVVTAKLDLEKEGKIPSLVEHRAGIKIPNPTQKPEQLIETLKASLRQAYRAVAKANIRSHVTNKKLYDKSAKHRSCDIGSYVYLFNPKKFFTIWSGPFRVMAKLSDLNYEILGRNGRKFVVHLNRLKTCHGRAHYGQSPARKQTGLLRQKQDMNSGPDQEADVSGSHLVLPIGQR